MFFFNGRIRNTHIVPIVTRNQPYSYRVGQSCIITGCLWIIIGLIFIFIGVISETEKPTFFSIGIFIFGAGFFVTVFAYFYTELNNCYRNWAYGSNVTPSNNEHSLPQTVGDITVSYFTGSTAVTPKVPTIISVSSKKSVKINKIIIAPSIEKKNSDEQD